MKIFHFLGSGFAQIHSITKNKICCCCLLLLYGFSRDNGGDDDEGCGGDYNRMFKQVNRK